jgi:hypothetical protein
MSLAQLDASLRIHISPSDPNAFEQAIQSIFIVTETNIVK